MESLHYPAAPANSRSARVRVLREIFKGRLALCLFNIILVISSSRSSDISSHKILYKFTVPGVSFHEAGLEINQKAVCYPQNNHTILVEHVACQVGNATIFQLHSRVRSLMPLLKHAHSTVWPCECCPVGAGIQF